MTIKLDNGCNCAMCFEIFDADDMTDVEQIGMCCPDCVDDLFVESEICD